MPTPEPRTTTVAALPESVPGEAKLYLRPVGLMPVSGIDGISYGRTMRRLAGGVFAFADCEVSIRTPGAVDSTVASLEEIEAWAERLVGRAQRRVTELIERLGASRVAPDGGRLQRPRLMGIINATPDSFSDGGEHLDPAAAVESGRRLAADGAAILDVGGESTRPGAQAVAPAVELGRVIPVLDGLAEVAGDLHGAVISIDTRKPEVMRAALRRGARVINDVSALTAHQESLRVAAESDAAVVLMHMQGEPAAMNHDPRYEDAALDVFDYLDARMEACVRAGIARDRLIADPGIAFGKRGAHNLRILRSLALYHGLGVPILLGISRKGLTRELDRRHPPKDRLIDSLTAALWALDHGVQMLRVHDVAAHRQAVDVWERLVGLRD